MTDDYFPISLVRGGSMFSTEDIRTVVEFESHDFPVLSVYLNVDPQARTPEQYKQALRLLLDKAEKADSTDLDTVTKLC